jgi:hypothetical protein
VLERFEQLIGPAKQGVFRFPVVKPSIARIPGDKMPLAMLADHFSAEMLDTNLKAPTARRALLDEVGWVRHRKNLLPPDDLPRG